jgi:hypothetical protein
LSETTFEHVNLNEVDPSAAQVTPGVYTFEVSDAAMKTFTYQKGDNAGKEGTRLALALTICDDPKLSGRRIFESLFPGKGTEKQCRRIMDATGISQSDTFAQWLTDLKESKARFQAPVVMKEQKQQDGTVKSQASVNLWEVSPV